MDRLGEFWRILLIGLAILAAVAFFVLGVRWLLAQDARDARHQADKAHVMVLNACGRQRAAQFSKVYSYMDGWDQVDKAEKWVDRCVVGP